MSSRGSHLIEALLTNYQKQNVYFRSGSKRPLHSRNAQIFSELLMNRKYQVMNEKAVLIRIRSKSVVFHILNVSSALGYQDYLLMSPMNYRIPHWSLSVAL